MSQQNVMSTIMDILRKMGISSNPDISNINTRNMTPFVVDMGDPVGNKSDDEQQLLDNLRIGVLKKIDHSKRITKRSVRVHGFKLDREDMWVPDSSELKIKDHKDGEPLKCPICGAEYNDSSEILLAQTLSYHDVMYSNVHDEGEQDGIRMSFPHLILTPICPQCYCSSLFHDYLDLLEKKPGLNSANMSPVFSIPDVRRQIIPLLPKCIVEQMGSDKSNTLLDHTQVLYWPKSPWNLICERHVRIRVDSSKKGS